MNRHLCTVALGLGLLCAALPCSAAVVAGPWLQNMTGDSITVMWEDTGQEPVAVQYWRNTAFIPTVLSVPAVLPPATLTDTEAILHTAVLPGLMPGSTYQYQIAGHDAAITFTLPLPDESMKVAHISDTEFFRQEHVVKTFAHVQAWNPTYVLITGDLSQNSTNTEYRLHMQRGQALWRRVPFYAVRGNHDSRAWSTYTGWTQHVFPDSFSEDYYRVDVGPITYIGLKAVQVQRLYPPGALDWLRQTLAAAASRPWTIVLMKPNPAVTWKDPFAEQQRFLMPLFKEHGVDLVLAGGNSDGYHRNVDGVWYLHAGMGHQHGWWGLDVTEDNILVQYHQPDGRIGNQFTVLSTYRPPISAFIVATPTEGLSPLTVHFTAKIPAQEGVTYHWDFGDGAQGAGAQEQHCFRQPGVYPVRLIVRTPDGQQSQAERRVSVQSNPCMCP